MIWQSFESFWNYANQTCSNNPLFTVILGDFNARSSAWGTGDKTTNEGSELESLTSCIDLIFTDQPNLIVHSGVYSSLHSNCHHQLIHCKLNFNIKYSPHYQRLIWNYNTANIKNIQRSTEMLDWENAFTNKNVDQQASLMNFQVLTNIFIN